MKKLKVYWDERGINPLPAHYRTMLKQVIRAAIGRNRGCEISISFVSCDEMHKLNKEYRSKDAPTDVLSFISVKSPHIVMGDIVICVIIAEKQAEEYGHSIERELAFLTAHGVLHLMGFDHQLPGDEKAMIKAQKEILTKVGIEIEK